MCRSVTTKSNHSESSTATNGDHHRLQQQQMNDTDVTVTGNMKESHARGSSSTGWSTTDSSTASSKMLGAVLTSLVALYVGMNRFNCIMTTFLMTEVGIASNGGSGGNVSASAKPMVYSCGILVVFAIRKIWNDRMTSMTKKVDHVMMRVSSNKTLTRIKSSSMRLYDLVTATGGQQRHHENGDGKGTIEHKNRRSPYLALHASPFVATDMIANLSLIDIKNLFRYVAVRNHKNFDQHIFLSSEISCYCHQVIHIMDRAVLKSRDGHSSISSSSSSSLPVPSTVTTTTTTTQNESTCIEEPKPTNDNKLFNACDIDVFYFIAIICIFAEWRTLRLVVPSSRYRTNKYTIGMNIGKRDLIQNANKIEYIAQQYMYEQEMKLYYTTKNKHLHNNNNNNVHLPETQSPTIRQLIQWEINHRNNIHTNLPKLREKSCASGFVWIYRQILYQNTIFQNIIQIPNTYVTSKDAVTAAYRSTYDHYHGFIIKNIFLSSLDAAPNHNELLLHMNPQNASNNNNNTSQCPSSHNTPITTSEPQQKQQIVVDDNNNPTQRNSVGTAPIIQRRNNPWEHITNHLVREWMKLERFMNQCHGGGPQLQNHNNECYNDDGYRNGFILPQKDRSTLDLLNYMSITAVMEKEEVDNSNDTDKKQCVAAIRATSDITQFSALMQPILSQWLTMINQLNINDPSRC